MHRIKLQVPVRRTVSIGLPQCRQYQSSIAPSETHHAAALTFCEHSEQYIVRKGMFFSLSRMNSSILLMCAYLIVDSKGWRYPFFGE
jgi:hypothetical protein